MTAEELLELLRSDECYEEVANTKQTWWRAITAACDWAEKKMNEPEPESKPEPEPPKLLTNYEVTRDWQARNGGSWADVSRHLWGD